MNIIEIKELIEYGLEHPTLAVFIMGFFILRSIHAFRKEVANDLKEHNTRIARTEGRVESFNQLLRHVENSHKNKQNQRSGKNKR